MKALKLPDSRGMYALFRRELSAFFQTPVAYVVAVVFLVASSTLFFSVFFLYDRAELRQFFATLPLLLSLLVPALSMRLIAEERRRGTYEILATLPLRTLDIILGKFLAVWVTLLFMLLPTLFYAFTVSRIGDLDPGPVFGGYLGAVLLAGTYASVGIFASSISRSEIVALIIALVISLSLALIESFIVLIPPPVAGVVQFLSATYHFDGFARGVVDSRSLVYLISVTTFFLTLSHRAMTSRR
ncbi:MAG: ABC transporter permease [Alkalispirochaetaceae bacterium]